MVYSQENAHRVCIYLVQQRSLPPRLFTYSETQCAHYVLPGSAQLETQASFRSSGAYLGEFLSVLTAKLYFQVLVGFESISDGPPVEFWGIRPRSVRFQLKRPWENTKILSSHKNQASGRKSEYMRLFLGLRQTFLAIEKSYIVTFFCQPSQTPGEFSRTFQALKHVVQHPMYAYTSLLPLHQLSHLWESLSATPSSKNFDFNTNN